MVNHVFGKLPSTQSDIALQVMLNEAADKVSGKALENDNQLVNLVSSDLLVGPGNIAIASLIDDLLNSMVENTSNSIFHFSAKAFSNITLVHFKTNSELNHPAFIASLKDLQPLANSIGATVELTSYRNNVSTVALSFISEGCCQN